MTFELRLRLYSFSGDACRLFRLMSDTAFGVTRQTVMTEFRVD